MTHPVSTPKLTRLVNEELSLLTAVLCLWWQE